MEPIPDFATLSHDELSSLIDSLEREEDAISYRRRLLHGRIDILRQENVFRLRAQVSGGGLPEHEAAPLARPLYAGSGEVPEPQELKPLPDLETLSDDELRSTIRELEREEDDISLRRRFLQGQIDILRAARYERLRTGAVDVADLARALTTRPPKKTNGRA